MRYYKSTSDDIVLCISTMDADGNGNITEVEYTVLSEMIAEMPEGKRIRGNGDGTYSYEDAPSMPDPEPTDEDYAAAGRILMGVEE